MDKNLKFTSNIQTGLTTQEVKDKISQNKINKINTKTSKTYKQIFFENLFTWFNLICFSFAGILIAVGSYNNLAFLLVFLANLLIGLIQEIKAKQIVDKISVFVSHKVEVLRDGEKLKIDIDKVVEGDILFFSSGDQICCDCVLLEDMVETNESLLTGESKPVKKIVGDSLLGGSFVVSGYCKAIAVKVGQESYSSSLVKKAKEFKQNESDILKTLNFVIKTIGILLIPLGILTFFDLRNSSYGVDNALVKTSGSVLSMMPVGMFLLTSVSLAVGVIKLARKRALVQELYSIEMLARTTVLCLDKTGTLTDGTMKVSNLISIGKNKVEDIKYILANYLSAFNTSNQTQNALREFFGKNKSEKILDKIDFSSERKFSAVSFEKIGTYILGAPEFATKNLKEDQKEIIKDFASKGFRVVILCKNTSRIKDGKIENNSKPIAIITLQDNIRKDAKKIIEWFNKNDVKIKIISGDNIDTVCNISKKVGVLGSEMGISLYGKTDEEVMALATKYNVFGRVTPEQKCLLVKALKKSGEKVAMTGDGVNDILALKESDCSIAMASGSEATRSASNLIMLDDNFSAMPEIVSEGRRVINNISKASSLFLSKTFFSIFLTIFALVSKFEYPLEPVHFLLWETFFVGIPAFLLALQPNNEAIKGSFIGNLTSKSLPGAIVLFLASMGAYVFASKTGNIYLIPTLISYTVTFGAFFILLNLCLPLDKYKTIVCVGALAITLTALLAIPLKMFNYMALPHNCLLFLGVTWIAIFIIYPLLKMLFEKFFEGKKKKHINMLSSK